MSRTLSLRRPGLWLLLDLCLCWSLLFGRACSAEPFVLAPRLCPATCMWCDLLLTNWKSTFLAAVPCKADTRVLKKHTCPPGPSCLRGPTPRLRPATAARTAPTWMMHSLEPEAPTQLSTRLAISSKAIKSYVPLLGHGAVRSLLHQRAVESAQRVRLPGMPRRATQ